MKIVVDKIRQLGARSWMALQAIVRNAMDSYWRVLSREDGHDQHKLLKSRFGCWIENRLKAEQKPKYKDRLEESWQEMMKAVEVPRNGQIPNTVYFED